MKLLKSLPPLILLVTTAVAASCELELMVLGNAQDGGAPQLGNPGDPAWSDPSLARLATSLGLVDRRNQRRYLFEATPDLRLQLHRLNQLAPGAGPMPRLHGIFLTHAHMGHYTGLMFLGHESMGARGVPVFAMPRMAAYLASNGPWSQLVSYGNIEIHPLIANGPALLEGGISVTPLPVPHREEFSEVVGFRVDTPGLSVLFIPDIDSWEDWDALGVKIENRIRSVDVAYLDATFFDDNELPGRDMSGFPHPRIQGSMRRFAALPDGEKAKIRFIHLNHSNPARFPDSPKRARVLASGFRIAEEGETVCLLSSTEPASPQTHD